MTTPDNEALAHTMENAAQAESVQREAEKAKHHLNLHREIEKLRAQIAEDGDEFQRLKADWTRVRGELLESKQQQAAARESALEDVRRAFSEPCPACGGNGWVEGPPDHHPTCDGNCDSRCPVQTQVECDCVGARLSALKPPAESPKPPASADPDLRALVAEGRALLAKATPGPWFRGVWGGQCHLKHAHAVPDASVCKYDPIRHDADDADDLFQNSIASESGGDVIGSDYDGAVISCDDAALIVWLRNNAEALLSALEEKGKP